MRHQLLEPLTDPSIAPSSKTNRRLPFNLQSSDLRMAASSGMIVCSALLINNGSQAAVSEVNTQPCVQPSDSAGVEKHCSKAVQHSTTASPEQSNQQWSNQLQSREQSDKLPSEMEAAYADLLNQAQAAASRDQLTEAVNIIAGIPKNSQHYGLVQQLQEEWSQELVRQATSHIQQAEIAPAIALLNNIPETSQWHDRSTELKQRWSQQAKLFNQAVAAKSASDWQGVIDSIKSLEGSPLYNSLPVQELLQQAMTKHYEPDAALLQIATADAPMMPTVAPPETVKIAFK